MRPEGNSELETQTSKLNSVPRYRRRKVTIHGKSVVGFSVAVHDLNDEDSLLLQADAVRLISLGELAQKRLSSSVTSTPSTQPNSSDKPAADERDVFQANVAHCAHEGAFLTIARGGCGEQCLPPIASTLRKLSRFKYGVGGKGGAKPDYIETVCGIEFLCWVDSSEETSASNAGAREDEEARLEHRILLTLNSPEAVTRYGVLCLGLSDDAVNDLSLCRNVEGNWHRLLPNETGSIELPIWVDHVVSRWTRWQRYEFESTPCTPETTPREDDWTTIIDPRISGKSTNHDR